MNKSDNEYVLIWAKKIKAINLLGGQCEKCGENSVFSLEFHHDGQKDHNINDLRRHRWSEIESEIKKCKLLCRNCHHAMHKFGTDRNIRIKQKLLDIKKSSGCSICGYSKNLGILEFHHEDSSIKKFKVNTCDIRRKNINWEDILLEIDKCVVLCSNCHIKTYTDVSRFNSLKEEIYNRINTHIELQPSINKDIVIQMYKQGIKQIEISKRLGCAKSTICGILKRQPL
jgi:hypothetical protein